MANKQKYYVYIYNNPLNKSKPYYIGKGEGFRYLSHINESKKLNILKHEIIQQIKDAGFEVRDHIIIYKSNLSEDDAYKLEKKLIKKYGRIGKECNGILTNRTVGGDSPPSQKGAIRSAQTRQKIRESVIIDSKKRFNQYVKDNKDSIYIALSGMKNKENKKMTLKKSKMTSDLYHKIQKNLKKYISTLNDQTEYNINLFNIKYINGMRITLFNEKRDILTSYYKLLDKGIKRKIIAQLLNVEPYQLDRWKKLRNDFEQFFD